MAVAGFKARDAELVRVSFHPPKTASVTAWYRAATARIEAAPDWRTVDMNTARITEDVIHFSCDEWDLFIARKKSLR